MKHNLKTQFKVQDSGMGYKKNDYLYGDNEEEQEIHPPIIPTKPPPDED